LATLEKAGVRKVFTDTTDLPTVQRPGFSEMLAYIHTGDEIVITSLTQLGTDNSELSAALDAVCARNTSLNILNFPSFAAVHDASERWQLTCAIRDLADFAKHRNHAGLVTATDHTHGDRGRKREYAPDSPNPAKRAIYRDVLDMLTASLPVTQIAKTVGINRKQIYRIKEYAQENGDLLEI
jgi:DNA invertase Pin-like site-specific DNA recombinase